MFILAGPHVRHFNIMTEIKQLSNVKKVNHESWPTINPIIPKQRERCSANSFYLIAAATCDAPLVYHDCYQRKCEPTCESLSSSDAACPKVPNVCFPGCYCPPGLVKKGDTCISPSNCGDCECNVLPHLQYVTYDDTNFTINANCVYVMSRDAVGEDKKHKFQVWKQSKGSSCVIDFSRF
jgi:hypothetical protein